VDGPGEPRSGIPWFVVGALTSCHIAALASSQVLNILVEPIKSSLAISDSEFSLLQGAAFALLAAIVGIPVASIADRGSRKRVIMFGVAGWTLGTLLCAVASSFSLLFLARVIVGFGEVFLFPAALSLLADAVPRDRFGTAFAIFASGGPLGAAIGLLGGGAIVGAWSSSAPSFGFQQAEGWRMAFLCCALLGLAALSLMFLLREPARTQRSAKQRSDFPAVLRYLRSHRAALVPLILGLLALCIAGSGLVAWAPTFAIRVLKLPFAQAGALVGAAALFSAVSGSWAAGMLVDRLAMHGDTRAPLIVSLLSLAGLVPAILIANFVGGAGAIGLFMTYFFLIVPSITGPVALEQVTPGEMRARVLAVYLLLVNAIAQTGGPTSVALLTDRYFRNPNAVGLSMAAVALVASLVGAFLIFRAMKPYRLLARQCLSTARTER